MSLAFLIKKIVRNETFTDDDFLVMTTLICLSAVWLYDNVSESQIKNLVYAEKAQISKKKNKKTRR